MKPEEKAKLLIAQFKTEQSIIAIEDDEDGIEEEKRELYFAKRCAMILADAMIEEFHPYFLEGTNYDWCKEKREYWTEVKEHIKKFRAEYSKKYKPQ